MRRPPPAARHRLGRDRNADIEQRHGKAGAEAIGDMAALRGVDAGAENIGLARGQDRFARRDGTRHGDHLAIGAIAPNGVRKHLDLQGADIGARRVEDAVEVTLFDLIEVDEDDFADAEASELLRKDRSGPRHANDANAEAAERRTHVAGPIHHRSHRKAIVLRFQ
jgi:hypothetical protein